MPGILIASLLTKLLLLLIWLTMILVVNDGSTQCHSRGYSNLNKSTNSTDDTDDDELFSVGHSSHDGCYDLSNVLCMP